MEPAFPSTSAEPTATPADSASAGSGAAPSGALPLARILGVAFLALTGVASLTHLAVRALGPFDDPRPLLWSGIGYGLFVCASLLWLMHAAGSGVLRLLRIPAEHREAGAATSVFRILAGWFALTVPLTLLNAVHRVDAVTVALTLGVGGALAWYGRSGSTRPRSPGAKPTGRVLVVAAGVAIFSAPFAIQLLLPNTDWDSAMYHLPLAERFVRQGSWTLEPLFEATAFPGGVHVLYALLLVLQAEAAILPLNFAAAILTLVLAGGLAAQLAGRAAGWWAAAAFASVNLFWELGLDPRIDGFLGLFSLAAVACVVLWAKHPHRTGLLPIGGLALGLAFGTKYTAAFPTLVLVPALVVLGVLARRVPGRIEAPSIRSIGSALALAAALASVPAGFWYARNAVHTGDPLYPMLGGRKYVDARGNLSSIDADWRALSAQLPAPPLGDFLDDVPPPRRDPRTLFSLSSLLLDPMRHARKSLHWLSPVLLAFLLLPWARRDRATLALFGIGIATWVAIGMNTGLVRYALPVLPVLAAGTGVVLARLWRNARLLVVGPLVAGMLLTITVFEWKKVELLRPGAYLSGAEDRLGWLSEVGYNFQPTLPRIVRQLNRAKATGRIPDDAVVFMIGEGKGHLLDLPHIPDSSWDSVRFLAEVTRADGDLARVAESMHDRGVRYVLFNRWYFRWVVERIGEEGRPHRARILATIRRFLDEHGSKVFEHADVELHRLEPSRRSHEAASTDEAPALTEP